MSNEPFSRIGGFAGFAFVGGVMLQNGVLLQGAPLPGATLEAVQAFYVDRRGPVSLAVGWVAINVPLLLVFGAAVGQRLQREARSSLFGWVGVGGVVLLAAAFLGTTWIQAVLTARAPDLAAAGTLGLVWDFHTAAFSTSGLALSVALGAFSVGGWRSEAVPKWTAAVGIVGTICLVISGLLAVGSVGGGPGIFFQLAGFVAWVVFLLAASVRLLKA